MAPDLLGVGFLALSFSVLAPFLGFHLALSFLGFEEEALDEEVEGDEEEVSVTPLFVAFLSTSSLSVTSLSSHSFPDTAL